MKLLKFLLPLVVLFFSFSCQHQTEKVQAPVVGAPLVKTNAPEQLSKPTVIMISIDGFRHDYLKRIKPSTLTAWAQDGVLANGLIPSFPTSTFPNHITLVTGLRPGRHGIVGNKFFDVKRNEFYAMYNKAAVADGTWYKAEPIWTAAEKQGMLAATAFWVGSEARIGGVEPTYLKPYDEQVPNDQRVAWVTEWLALPEATRPHYINLYFSDVDSMGHKFGPDSEEVKTAVLNIDSSLAKLKSFIEEKKLDVQIIVLSDHGMKKITHTIDLSGVTVLQSFKNSGGGALISFYNSDPELIKKAYSELNKVQGAFHTYLASQLPKRWQFDDVDRRGDIIVVGEPGVSLKYNQSPKPAESSKPANVASHGWDAKNSPELNGLFIARGSAFKKGLKIPAFDNVHIYPVVMDLLKLNIDAKIDGDDKVSKSIRL